MSAGTPAKTKREQEAQRRAYMNSLKLESSNIQKNFNANEIYKATGTAAIPKSTETASERGATIQGKKQMIKEGLVSAGIMNSFVAENFIDALGEQNVDFFLQNSQAIMEGFKPKNVPAKVFLAYFNKYEKRFAQTSGMELGVPALSGTDYALDQRTMDQALAGNRQALIDFKEQIKGVFAPEEARRLTGRIDDLLDSIPTPEELEELQRLDEAERTTIQEAIRQNVLRAPDYQTLMAEAQKVGLRGDPDIVNMGRMFQEDAEAQKVREEERRERLREVALQVEEAAAREQLEKQRKRSDVRERIRQAVLRAKQEGTLEIKVEEGKELVRHQLMEITERDLQNADTEELQEYAQNLGINPRISKGADRKKLISAIQSQQKMRRGDAGISYEDLYTMPEKQLRLIAKRINVDENIIVKGDLQGLITAILAQIKLMEAQRPVYEAELDEDEIPVYEAEPYEDEPEDEPDEPEEDEIKDRAARELGAEDDFPTPEEVLESPADWPDFARSIGRNLSQRLRRAGLSGDRPIPWNGNYWNAEDLIRDIGGDEDKIAAFIRGMRPRRTAALGLKGRGLSRQKTPVEKSEGYKKPIQYVQFGRYMIHHPKLKEGVLQLRTPKGGAVKVLPSEYLTPRVRDMMLTMVGNGSPSLEDFHRLTADEKEKLHLITRHSQYEKVSIPKGNMDKEEQELHKFTILKGEIMAGNNNRQLLKEFKTMLMKFVGEGKVPRRQANEILAELAKEGL